MVRIKAGEFVTPRSGGEDGWAGCSGTLFWIDPKEQLIAVGLLALVADLEASKAGPPRDYAGGAVDLISTT
jgi:CubicO group peptidase (beta-lactamase class C family)